MALYGTISSGVLTYAPSSGMVAGELVINMTAEHHARRGELPIMPAVAPDGDAGGHYEQEGWRVRADGAAIEAVWRYVADEPAETLSVGTIGDMRGAIRKLAAAAGMAVSALALCVRAAGVDAVNLNDVDLDSAPNVVTAVDFSGLATEAALDSLGGSVANLWTYVYGESVWFAVSNYLSTSSRVPTLRLMEVRDGATNEVYSSAREIAGELGEAIASATNAMPEKAWSRYQSMTGEENPAPESVTVISTPMTLFAGGHEWQKFADSSGAAFLLSGGGSVSAGGGEFAIKSETGKTYWRIATTAAIVTNAPAASVGWKDGVFSAAFVSAVQPTLYISEALTNAFLAATDEPNVSATWTAAGESLWRVDVSFVDRPRQFFAVAKTEIAGVEAIVHEAATQLSGGLLIGGVRYNVVAKTVGGELVLGLEAAK